VVSSTPRSHCTPAKTRYPFYSRLGEPQGQSGRVEKLVATGIRFRTVQPVVAIPTELPGPQIVNITLDKKKIPLKGAISVTPLNPQRLILCTIILNTVAF